MKSRVDRIVDLLVDEVEQRLRARRPAAEQAAPRPVGEGQPSAEPVAPREEVSLRAEPAATAPGPEPPAKEAERAPARPVEPAELEGPSHAAGLMVRLALGLLVAVVVINIPWRGRTLATAVPYSASLIIRDGLVVTEEGDERIYVYQDGAFRWISSLDAFEHYGYTWGDVHVVEEGYLDQFEIGTPLHVLLKCPDSPHIYRLEDGHKRWIRDIETFEAEGHVWEDVRMVPCEYLRDLPDGETIPPESGPPPQP